MNPTTSEENPQVLSRKGDPITGINYPGEEDLNNRNADIESLRHSIKIAQQQGKFDLVYKLMGEIENLKQKVTESILPDIAAGLGRTGVPFSTTYDPSGDCGSQPQGIAKQELNDPEEDAKDTKTKIDLLTKKLDVAKMRKDWGEVFNLMNQLEGLRGL